MTRLLTISEAASRLGVHYQTLRVWADTGRLPCVRVGGKRRFDPDAVEALAVARARGYDRPGVEAFDADPDGPVSPAASPSTPHHVSGRIEATGSGGAR